MGSNLFMWMSGAAFLMLLTYPRDNPWIPWTALACIWGLYLVWAFPHGVRFGKVMRNPRCTLPGLLLSALVAYNQFYGNWLHGSLYLALAAKIGLMAKLLLLAFSGGLGLLAVPALAYGFDFLFSAGAEALNAERSKGGIDAKRSWMILTSINLIGFWGVLRTNFYYIDDFGRAAYGYKEWSYFSRYLSTELSSIVHMDSFLADVSPMPQLLALAIMAASGVLLLHILCGRKSFSVWELAALIPLTLNPYFLECLSYKYDAPYMALSVFGGILPLLYRRSSESAYLGAVTVGTWIVCTTYQAAAGIFPMLVIVLALQMWNRGEKFSSVLRFCILSALAYAGAMVIFQTCLMRLEKTYFSSGLPSANRILPTVVQNLRTYYGLIFSDFKPIWLVLSGIVMGVFVLRMVLGSHRNRWASGCLALAGLFLLLLLCFGIYPALETTQFDPRGMYGFGVLLTILGVFTVMDSGTPFRLLPTMALCWAFFVFAFVYGNALNVQKEYTDFRIRAAIADLNDISQLADTPTVVSVRGTIGYSPIIENMSQDYNMLRRLVPVNFSGTWLWGEYGFHTYYGMKNVVWIENLDEDENQYPLLKDTMFHTLRGDSEMIFVVLK